MPTTQADGWRAVQAGPDDKSVLKNLLLDSPIKHQHLDWFQSQDLLDREPFIFAYLDDMPVGGLACPPEPIETAWLRLFFTSRAASPHNVWASTWPQAMQSAIEQGTTRFAALIFDPWFRNILSEEGFVESNTVVFLEWETVEGFPPPVRDLALRGMRPQDIELLTSLDHQAFAQIWRHTSDPYERD